MKDTEPNPRKDSQNFICSYLSLNTDPHVKRKISTADIFEFVVFGDVAPRSFEVGYHRFGEPCCKKCTLGPPQIQNNKGHIQKMILRGCIQTFPD